ncbi:MAG: gamma-glutamylcyclotransferase [Desulfonatronovibrio sp. MSAO_Bac4]|nr:MAG: gamma-glutamylcyclotransferase [Desulfonatronovibrio sp. MSAO_Bac4]
MKYYVFVYGTLRQGCSNHHLLKNARFLGRARTMEKYALYVDDFPYLYKEQPWSRIRGEVYEVDDDGFSRLDELENHPFWYQREKRAVILEGGVIMDVWVYFFPRAKGTLVNSGDYLASDLCCNR